MSRIPIGSLLILLVVLGCQQGSKEATMSPVDSLRTVVMDLHNVEMEKMGQMKMLERELKSLLNETDSLEDSETYTMLSLALAQLDSGTFAMKSWMRNWKEPDTLASVESQLEGLSQQYESMKRTRDLMNTGIGAAQNALSHEE